jgi:transposase
VTGHDNRLFVEWVLWVAHTDAPWRDLPTEFGRWYSVEFSVVCGSNSRFIATVGGQLPWVKLRLSV